MGAAQPPQVQARSHHAKPYVIATGGLNASGGAVGTCTPTNCMAPVYADNVQKLRLT